MTSFVWHRAFDDDGTASLLLQTFADEETVAEWSAEFDDGSWRVEMYQRPQGYWWDGTPMLRAEVAEWKAKPVADMRK